MFICKNNVYERGTSVERTSNTTDIWKLGLGYEMPCGPVDGMDPVKVAKAIDEAISRARSGEGPLAGMPIIDADKAGVVVIVKRSLSVGYAGVDNDLFYEDKTMMLFGDGKQMMTELVSSMKDL